MEINKKFTLVFSGGSAYGIAHLGIIKFLEENNKNPNEIIGTSMGSLIGAAFAKGLSYSEISRIMENISYLKLFKFNLIKRNSLVDMKNIKKFLIDIFGDDTFLTYELDLKIIATNIKNGNIKVFDKNNNVKIVDALCASFSIPGLFEPYQIKKSSYWDGYLSSNLPFEFSSNKQILAIDVIGLSMIEKISSNSITSSLEKSFFLSIYNQTKSKIENNNNIKNKEFNLITLNLSGYNPYDFHKWKEISNIGYKKIKKEFT